MIRRALLVAAAAFALISVTGAASPAAPAVVPADGYGAHRYPCTVLRGHGHASEVAIDVVCNGNHGDEAVTLTITSNPASTSKKGMTIAGTKSLTKVANASGVATFTVTLTGVGTYSLVATNAAGSVISSQSVKVPAVIAAGVSASAAAPTRAAANLGSTGFDGMPLAVGGGVLVLAGAGAVLVVRRRRSTRVTT